MSRKLGKYNAFAAFYCCDKQFDILLPITIEDISMGPFAPSNIMMATLQVD